jgi:predicted O-methyltransferase YrrM
MKVESTTWTAVDDFIADALIPGDAVLEAALADSATAGLPAINVTAPQGRLLQILAQTLGAKAILEVGTLGGYSTIWLARALPPGGRMLTLEINAATAKIARANLARAGLDGVVEVRVGPALDSLRELVARKPPPFDLVFIDADKVNNPDYFRAALELTRSGSLIVVDNVVREGEILDERSQDASVRGTRELYAVMGAEPRVTATAIQTVGSKGYDGFAIARVR